MILGLMNCTENKFFRSINSLHVIPCKEALGAGVEAAGAFLENGLRAGEAAFESGEAAFESGEDDFESGDADFESGEDFFNPRGCMFSRSPTGRTLKIIYISFS